jgi:tRNA (guanine-N7-)-methyltransferase
MTMQQTKKIIIKPIKSFVLRQGKITTGQQNAINDLMPKYGIEFCDTSLDLNHIFGRNNPKIIEIGFGMGTATWQIARDNPNNDYLGIEVHNPGVGSLLMAIEQHQLSNIRIIRYDAVAVLKHMITDNTIDGFHIYFPDPWHKKRHHKRRIIQNELVLLLCNKLKQKGYIHLATDWKDYAIWMLNILNNIPTLKNTSITNDFVPRPTFRPVTKFEDRGIKLNHGVWDLIFVKI